MRRSFLFYFTMLLFFSGFAACGENSTTSDTQTVQVKLSEFTIASSVTTFSPGKRYHFIVTNTGQTTHELMIMPYPMEMMGDMKSMDKMALASLDALTPGQTKTLDYTFPASTIHSHPEFACYYPGHYQAGMKLDVSVNG